MGIGSAVARNFDAVELRENFPQQVDFLLRGLKGELRLSLLFFYL